MNPILPLDAPPPQPHITPTGASESLLKGEVCVQYIRCNKPGCRCQTGATHGPYYYRVWREGGRVRKVYVKSDDLVGVRAACDAYKAYSLRLRDLRRQRERLVRHIHGEWRKTQRFLKQADNRNPAG